MEDRNSIRFSMSAPEGTSFDQMQDISDEVVNYLNDSIPEKVISYFLQHPGFGGGGVNAASGRIGSGTSW